MRTHRRQAGHARLIDHVTPTTAGLLQWWFGAERAQARGGLEFTEAQQQAIFNTITRHETERRAHRVAPPRHRVGLGDGAGTVRVLLALMLWQLLNHTDTRAAGLNDPRFTRHFVAITPRRVARERLMDALWGQPLAGVAGVRDFGTADWVRCAALLIPDARRDEVYAFMCGSVCSGQSLGPTGAGDDLIVITDERPPSLGALPHLMVFADEARNGGAAQEDTISARRKQLRRIVSLHGKPCMEVVFSGSAL